VSDIFNEVDEEVRREQLKKLWEHYGAYIVALAVVVVLAVAAWQGYVWWETKKAAESGTAFEAAITLSDEGKQQDAQAAFAKLASGGSSGYRILAPLRAAAELGRSDPAAAAKIYDELASDSSLGPVLQDFAGVRAGYLLVDTAAYDEMLRRLEPLTAANRPFRHSARALLALSALRAGNAKAVRDWSDMVITDPEAPAGTRNRVEMYLALVGSDSKS
jgi:hypothetical protein